jgi:3-deoxy-manno-octulosonate cytidylyltransferase (CMP-KDO synthetase)
MKQVIFIPARMGGTRLPGKPLISILGKPIIQHVWERCIQAHPSELIFVITEDEAIKKFCDQNKIQCLITKKAETAIDRVKFGSDIIDADVYINVQGDEPIVNIADIKKILEYTELHPERVVFGKTKATEDDFFDHSKAKVVCNQSGRLIYSSRAGIPLSNKGKFVGAERAIWIYGFHKFALDSYHHSSGKTKLDMTEDNEIIRFLEIDIPVYCIDLIGDSWAVDEFKDLEVVKNRMIGKEQ